jgi:hypothetical protein
LRNVTNLVSTGRTDIWVVWTIQAVIRIRNVKTKARIWLFISSGLVGEFAIRAIEPIESERPKIRSESV